MRPFPSVLAPAAFAVGMVCAGGATAAGFDVPCDATALLLALEQVNANGEGDCSSGTSSTRRSACSRAPAST